MKVATFDPKPKGNHLSLLWPLCCPRPCIKILSSTSSAGSRPSQPNQPVELYISTIDHTIRQSLMHALSAGSSWLGLGLESCLTLLEARNLCLHETPLPWMLFQVSRWGLFLEMVCTLPIYFHTVSQSLEFHLSGCRWVAGEEWAECSCT